jgi:hypothetical protein
VIWGVPAASLTARPGGPCRAARHRRRECSRTNVHRTLARQLMASISRRVSSRCSHAVETGYPNSNPPSSTIFPGTFGLAGRGRARRPVANSSDDLATGSVPAQGFEKPVRDVRCCSDIAWTSVKPDRPRDHAGTWAADPAFWLRRCPCCSTRWWSSIPSRHAGRGSGALSGGPDGPARSRRVGTYNSGVILWVRLVSLGFDAGYR